MERPFRHHFAHTRSAAACGILVCRTQSFYAACSFRGYVFFEPIIILAQYCLNSKPSPGGLSLWRTWTMTQNLPESRITDFDIVFCGRTGFVLGCVALGWSSFGIWIFYFWQFLENLRGASPLAGTAQIAPAGISGLCAAVATGFLLSRLHPGYIMAFAMLAFCAGNILFATMPVSQMYVYFIPLIGTSVLFLATGNYPRVEMLTPSSPNSYWLNAFLSIIIAPWGMDMSFPASTVILSDSMPRKHQGLAASLVNTVVNYSISIGLGIGGTVEVNVNRGNTDLLRGYRGAWYAGIGLSGMGILFASYFVVSEHLQRRRVRHG